MTNTFKTCPRCQGLGEIIVAHDEADHGPKKDDTGEVVEECPDCGGEGIIEEVQP